MGVLVKVRAPFRVEVHGEVWMLTAIGLLKVLDVPAVRFEWDYVWSAIVWPEIWTKNPGTASGTQSEW